MVLSIVAGRIAIHAKCQVSHIPFGKSYFIIIGPILMKLRIDM